MSEQVSEVLAAGYKKPFSLFVALVAAFIAFFVGIRSIESFVDGRVDMKLSAARVTVEDHEKRLTKIEERLGSMTEVLSDIRADVKVMRAQMERK